MRLARLGPLLVLVGALAAAAGCAGPLVSDAPETARPEAFPNHSVAEILRSVDAQTRPLTTFKSQSRIKVERPGQRATLSARFRQSPDSLFGTLSGPFGIRIGEGLVTPDSFFVAYTFGGAYYLGALDAASRVVPIPPSSSDLFASLTGTVAPALEAQWTVSNDDAHYVLVTELPTASGPVQQRLRIDPALWRVVEATDYDPAGSVVGVRTFSAFDQVDGLVVPRRVEFHVPQDEASVTIEHVEVTVNPAALSFPRPRPGRSDVTLVE